MKKILLVSAFALFGTFAMANEIDNNKNELSSKFLLSYILTPSVCEAGANAAYQSVKDDGGSDRMAENAYNAALKACETQMKEANLD